MTRIDIKRALITLGFGLAILVAANVDISAQSRREMERERQRIERENAGYQRQRRDQYRGNRNDSRVTGRMEQRVDNANYSNGYQQGLLAGQYDRRKRKYNQSNVYRDSGSYPNQGDPTSSDYIYRQGYLQGYNDGYNGIRNY
ncbi:MAG TPA: hypothetical protein VMZ26_07170 [Pyrinomonadaceae bacterium]|nr:hypothetical protein [Pyrinomonadaceae bacterium]